MTHNIRGFHCSLSLADHNIRRALIGARRSAPALFTCPQQTGWQRSIAKEYTFISFTSRVLTPCKRESGCVILRFSHENATHPLGNREKIHRLTRYTSSPDEIRRWRQRPVRGGTAAALLDSCPLGRLFITHILEVPDRGYCTTHISARNSLFRAETYTREHAHGWGEPQGG